MKLIKPSVINTFKRVGIDYQRLDNTRKDTEVSNWLTRESVITTELIAHCIKWIYATSLAMEQGNSGVSIADFDRVRYFIFDQDKDAYNICVD